MSRKHPDIPNSICSGYNVRFVHFI